MRRVPKLEGEMGRKRGPRRGPDDKQYPTEKEG